MLRSTNLPNRRTMSGKCPRWKWKLRSRKNGKSMQYFEYFDVHFVELNEVIKWTFVSSYKVTCLHQNQPLLTRTLDRCLGKMREMLSMVARGSEISQFQVESLFGRKVETWRQWSMIHSYPQFSFLFYKVVIFQTFIVLWTSQKCLWKYASLNVFHVSVYKHFYSIVLIRNSARLCSCCSTMARRGGWCRRHGLPTWSSALSTSGKQGISSN